MCEQRTISRVPVRQVVLGLLLTLSLVGCGTSTPEKPHRLVLVVDPTVLRDVNAAEFDRLLGGRLRASLANLPEDSFLDLYFVGLGQTGLPADFRGSLPFRADESTEEGHRERASAMADSVAKLVRSRWAVSSERRNDPSSCILTALYRAQEMTRLGVRQDEDVTLVVISDFLEACTDTGHNFERLIPDSLGALPVQADLSGAKRVLMLRMQTMGAVALRDEPRLIRYWTHVLERWQVDTAAVEFTPNFPDLLIPASSRI